jgi:hypothetical protein
MKFDFGGYATKNDLKCADGRTIRKNAFKDCDGKTVPLVWQHMHNDPDNVLGHAILENREDGVYAYGVFNDNEAGKKSKRLVQHGDIVSLSIYANDLVQKNGSVLHGAIREVSLVLAGANPGAYIENLEIEHADGTSETDDGEAIICSGDDLSTDEDTLEHSDSKPNDGKTVKDVLDTLNDEQKNVVYAMLAHALGEDSEDSSEGEDDSEDSTITHSNKGGKVMKHNIFDKPDQDDVAKKNTLSHAQILEIFSDAQKCGSLKESFLQHAGTYGIDNIDVLFPDATTVTPTPDLIKRDTNWVQQVISAAHHSPFSRIKSTAADITADQARAKGYVKGTLKKDEVFSLLKRTTTPTTIYKKQKLDRDDIVDITDLDIVAFMKMEMRVMFDEELARAMLIGDLRAADDPDKVKDPVGATDGAGIRSIYRDAEMYAEHVKIVNTETTSDVIEEIIKSHKDYKGSGNPNFYTTPELLTTMLLLKDSLGRRLYRNADELASELRVNKIIEVPVMDGVSRVDGSDTLNLLGIIVNLTDYTIGADKGGAVSMFDDFDIDYNQFKYLIESRCSGALTHPKSALVIEQVKTVAAG